MLQSRFAVLGLALLAVLASALAADAAELFPLRAGIYWDYVSEGNSDHHLVIQVQSQVDFHGIEAWEVTHTRYLDTTSLSETFYYVEGADGSIQRVGQANGSGSQQMVYDPPMPFLPATPTAGELWNGSYRWDVYQDGAFLLKSAPFYFTAQVMVTGQPLSTPIGHFSATRLDVDYTHGAEDWHRVWWFAPGAGIVRFQELASDPFWALEAASFGVPNRDVSMSRLKGQFAGER